MIRYGESIRVFAAPQDLRKLPLPVHNRCPSYDIDQVIPAGKRIALMIFSSDRDFTVWPEAGTKLTVDLNSTLISLPVVGGQAAFDQAFGQR